MMLPRDDLDFDIYNCNATGASTCAEIFPVSIAALCGKRGRNSVSLIFLCLLLGSIVNVIECDNLLLIGDSCDRQATEEWCNKKTGEGNPTNHSVWGPWELSARHATAGRMGTFYCRTNLDSVAYVQVYGSGAVGPYANHGRNPNDTSYHTPVRLNLGISIYKSLYGLPDRIIYQTVQWDIKQQYSIKNFVFVEAVEKFRLNTIARIGEIMDLVDKSVDVGIRTAPKSSNYPALVQSYNNVIRELAITMNLTLYDYDHDVWSSVNFDRKMEPRLFRDWVHPRYPYTAFASDKMLGRQFTNQISFAKGSRWDGIYNARFDKPIVTSSIVHLWQDKESNVTSFLNSKNASRHRSPNKEFLQAMRLGPADVRTFHGTNLYEETSEGENIPTLFIDGSFLNITVNSTTSAQLYHYKNCKLRLVTDHDMIVGLGKTELDITQVDEKNAYWTSMVETDIPVDKQYAVHSDWLLREEGGRSVYLVRNGTRTHMTGVESMAALNKTVDDVITLPNLEGAFLTPLAG